MMALFWSPSCTEDLCSRYCKNVMNLDSSVIGTRRSCIWCPSSRSQGNPERAIESLVLCVSVGFRFSILNC
ncbi:hypothetical protein NC651_029233 [Populus alba x Populus x berolinensis]|nr:hypothetical protein NC651_029233 [Populus alba x Populus x berolinensis]